MSKGFRPQTQLGGWTESPLATLREDRRPVRPAPVNLWVMIDENPDSSYLMDLAQYDF
jgi:hypothetical protein